MVYKNVNKTKQKQNLKSNAYEFMTANRINPWTLFNLSWATLAWIS